MKKILVVDDDEPILAVISTILRKGGFEVFTDMTGADVPGLIKSYSPDVVLLDIWLPGKSGIEICKELKQISSVPIVLFSAQSDRDKALKESRAEAFIQKPFDLEDLLNVITFHASYQMDEAV